MFELPWKHDGFNGRKHGTTKKQIRGFDDRFAAYAEVLAQFPPLEKLAVYFEPHDSDGDSTKPDSGDDNQPEGGMYQRLSDRILQKIREAASGNAVLVSRVATVVLHDKTLPSEDIPGEEDVVEQNYYEREYKYYSTGVEMTFIS